jgi:hypothetical protein
VAGVNLLNRHIHIVEFRSLDEESLTSGATPRSKNGIREARIADTITSMAGSPEGCIHLRED